MQTLDNRTARLMNFAGFAMAQAIALTATGGKPCVALAESKGERGFVGPFKGSLDDAVTTARTTLAAIPELGFSALAFAAEISLGEETANGIVVEAAHPGALDVPVVVIQLYREEADPAGYAVLGSVMLPEVPDEDRAAAMAEAVMEGARENQEAFGHWMKKLEE